MSFENSIAGHTKYGIRKIAAQHMPKQGSGYLPHHLAARLPLQGGALSQSCTGFYRCRLGRALQWSKHWRRRGAGRHGGKWRWNQHRHIPRCLCLRPNSTILPCTTIWSIRRSDQACDQASRTKSRAVPLPGPALTSLATIKRCPLSVNAVGASASFPAGRTQDWPRPTIRWRGNKGFPSPPIHLPPTVRCARPSRKRWNQDDSSRSSVPLEDGEVFPKVLEFRQGRPSMVRHQFMST